MRVFRISDVFICNNNPLNSYINATAKADVLSTSVQTPRTNTVKNTTTRTYVFFSQYRFPGRFKSDFQMIVRIIERKKKNKKLSVVKPELCTPIALREKPKKKKNSRPNQSLQRGLFRIISTLHYRYRPCGFVLRFLNDSIFRKKKKFFFFN